MNAIRRLPIVFLLFMLAFIIPVISLADSHLEVFGDDLGDVTGSADNPVYSTLNEALDAIGSTPTTLFINKELTLDETITIVPSNVTLNFMKGGSLTVGTGQTVIFNGTIEAPDDHIFNVSDYVIEDCEDAWDEQSITGVTSNIDTADKQAGNASVKLTVDNNANVGILASESISQVTMIKASVIFIWVKTDISILNDGDLQLLLDDSPGCISPLCTIDLKPTPANTWRRYALPIGDASLLTDIVSIGIKQTVDLGPFTIWLDEVTTHFGVYFEEGSIDEVHAEWFLPQDAVTDGSIDYSKYLQNAVDSIKSGTVVLPPFTVKASVAVMNKSRYRVTGKGSTIKAAVPFGYCFDLGSGDNIQFDSFTIIGDASGDPSYRQGGIGNNSGYNLSNVTIRDMYLKDLNIGICLTADLGGTYDRAVVANNRIENIKGILAGQGYGITLSNVYNTIVENNIIVNCDRHAIYNAKGINLGLIIRGNLIKDHRKDVYNGSVRPAVVVSRSTGVEVTNNTFIDCYDSSLLISYDETVFRHAGKDVIRGNSFINRKNFTPDIQIGTETVASSEYFTYRLLIEGNSFYTNDAVSVGGNNILINNGMGIKISNNIFNTVNVGSRIVYPIRIGVNAYINSEKDCTYIDVSNNTFVPEGTNISTYYYPVYISSDVCGGLFNSYFRITGNYVTGTTNTIRFGVANVNPNIIIETKKDVTYNFGSIDAHSSAEFLAIVDGAKPISAGSSIVSVSPGGGNVPDGLVFTAFPHSTDYNVVVVRATNITDNSIDPPSLVYRIKVEDE